MAIELSGVQFDLKTYAWFQNHKYDFILKSHMAFFVFHFPTMWLASLKKP